MGPTSEPLAQLAGLSCQGFTVIKREPAYAVRHTTRLFHGVTCELTQPENPI
jgi:hypothetical protein